MKKFITLSLILSAFAIFTIAVLAQSSCQEFYDETNCYATTYESSCGNYSYASSTEPEEGEGCSDVEEDEHFAP